ncbi:MAG: hypothetical protein GY842_13240, partial [bacterium]|nr:hypothetical protein [bacterium]
AASLGAPLYVAYPFEVDLDLGSSGTWELLDDGSRLWRLRIHSPTALRLNLGFTRFGLPAGGISNGGALSRCRGWSDSADVFRVGRVRTGWPAFADGQARPPSAAGDGDEAPPGFEASAILPPEMARGPPRLELWLSGQVERSRQKLGELGRSVCEEAFRRLNEVETGKEHEE